MGYRKKVRPTGGTGLNPDGFTLFEVIVALMVLTLAISALLGSFRQLVYTEEQLRGRVTALIIGRGKLAELEQGSEKGSSGVFAVPYSRFSWSCREETAADGGSRLILTLKWRNQNGLSQEESFSGYRAAD